MVFAAAMAATLITTNSSVKAQAQDDQNNRRQQFMERMNERLKTALKVKDDEWAVIQPLIEKVQTKQREANAGRFGAFGGGNFGGRGRGGNGGAGGDTAGGGNNNNNGGNNRGGQGGPGGAGGGSPEVQALRTALESDSTSADEIKAKLAAVRDSRKKAAGELESARADLKKVLTQRQEATLVSMGILE